MEPCTYYRNITIGVAQMQIFQKHDKKLHWTVVVQLCKNYQGYLLIGHVYNKSTYTAGVIVALQRSKAWNTKYYQDTFLIISRLLHDISKWSTRNKEA